MVKLLLYVSSLFTVLSILVLEELSVVQRRLLKGKKAVIEESFPKSLAGSFELIKALSELKVKDSWKLTQAAINTASQIVRQFEDEIEDGLHKAVNIFLKAASTRFKTCLKKVKKTPPDSIEPVISHQVSGAIQEYSENVKEFKSIISSLVNQIRAATATFWFFQKADRPYKILADASKAAKAVINIFQVEQKRIQAAIDFVDGVINLQQSVIRGFLELPPPVKEVMHDEEKLLAFETLLADINFQETSPAERRQVGKSFLKKFMGM